MDTPEERGIAAQKAFEKFSNSSQIDSEEAFINGMMRSHRTLQQKQVRLMIQAIEAYAEFEEKDVDLRLKGTVMVCREFVHSFKEKHDGNRPSIYLPLI